MSFLRITHATEAYISLYRLHTYSGMILFTVFPYEMNLRLTFISFPYESAGHGQTSRRVLTLWVCQGTAIGVRLSGRA